MEVDKNLSAEELELITGSLFREIPPVSVESKDIRHSFGGDIFSHQ